MAELVRTGELRRFLPQPVAERLLAGDLGADTSLARRRITVLSADMVGFTDLSESLEPEELAEVVDEYLREMTALVVSHSGTLIDFAGDGVFAIYGAPTPSEENVHALQALRTAVAIRARVRELAAELRRRGIPADVQVRVGVNTGHCTVGVFGSDVMRAYKAVGFPVNVAARLQSEAEPGTILCGFRTYALAENAVRAVRREPLTVKGAARPIEAWEIVELAEAERAGQTTAAAGSD